MRAFISHSSKDKSFVRQIVEQLGPMQCEYDEFSFEYTLNTQSIRKALARSEMFVLFLSESSIKSTYVQEEELQALEARARGTLRKILIVAIDQTSYHSLPEWLREINIAQNISSPKACARRIQAALLELEAQENHDYSLYVGREQEEKLLRQSVSKPPLETPAILHIVGHLGIGRRTFLRHSLRKLYPRIFDVFIETTISEHEGIENLYRQLYDLHIVSSLQQKIEDFENYARLSAPEQVKIIVGIIDEMAQRGEFVFIVDEGGIYDEHGDYQVFMHNILDALQHTRRPMLALIQTRMMPFSLRSRYPKSAHINLPPLNDDDVKQILALSLNDCQIDFKAETLTSIVELLDGHPYNARFAVKFISEYGIQSFLDDPSDLLTWKRRRAEDFLRKIEFSEFEIDILVILHHYRFVSSDLLVGILSITVSEVAKCLRRLQEYCCVEHREAYYYISSPIREALRRDIRFQKDSNWLKSIALAICEAIREYENDESIRVGILETGTIAAVHHEGAPQYLSNLILPSHLLRIAKDFYDKGLREFCIDFCKRAFELRNRLPVDGQIELFRLWGLSSVRLNDTASFRKVLRHLAGYSTPTAKRVSLFLEGFDFRTRGIFDKAEEKFLEAWNISPQNQSINREIASLLCKQKRYTEAEEYARAVYDKVPTNPFIIDILLEALIGKEEMGFPIDKSEVGRLLEELRTYGDAPGASFFLIRDGQRRSSSGDLPGSVRALSKAIERTPNLLAPYFLRAEVYMKMHSLPEAERDLQKLRELLLIEGGSREGDQGRLEDLEIALLIEKGFYRNAKEKIDNSNVLSTRVEQRLYTRVAKAIAFAPDTVDLQLRGWARSFPVSSGREAT